MWKNYFGKKAIGKYGKDLASFCYLALKVILVSVALILLFNFALVGFTHFRDFLIFLLVLVICVLPQGLQVVFWLALTWASAKMKKEHVTIKKLSAIESMGNIELLCTDKTGTLTQNKLSLEKIISSNKDKALLYSLVGAQAGSKEAFFMALSARAGHRMLSDAKKYAVIASLPFHSIRMCESHVVKKGDSQMVLITKGAPEVILTLCSKFPAGYVKSDLKEEMAKEGQDGKRVLAIAFKNTDKNIISKPNEKGLTFLGYFVFDDPIKTTAEEAIRLTKKLGVQIKMITGDSKELAGFVGKKMGLIGVSTQVLLGEELEKMHQDDFDNACEDSAVFARVSPNTKHRILVSLQKRYETAFLGEISGVELLKKDLRVMLHGIKTSRAIFFNINKYITGSLAINLGNFYSIGVISLFLPFLPVLPWQILLGTILSGLLLVFIFTRSVDIVNLKQPSAYQLHTVLPKVFKLGIVNILFYFLFFIIFSKISPTTFQTAWFILLILNPLLLLAYISVINQLKQIFSKRIAKSA